MSVYQSNVSKNKVELKQAQYKDIDKRYYDQLIQLKVKPFSYCLIIQSVKTLHCMINSKDFCNRQLRWQTRTWTDITMPLTSKLASYLCLYSPFVCFLVELMLADII